MLRDEYVDHVAALCAAALATRPDAPADAGEIAEAAIALAEALAAARYDARSGDSLGGDTCPLE